MYISTLTLKIRRSYCWVIQIVMIYWKKAKTQSLGTWEIFTESSYKTIKKSTRTTDISSTIIDHFATTDLTSSVNQELLLMRLNLERNTNNNSIQ